MDIAVLGAGLDGLLAAHAIVLMGHKPVIFGDTKVVEPYIGSRVITRDIPSLDLLHMDICTRPNMDADETDDMSPEAIEEFAINYCTKVFGPEDVDFYIDKYGLQELNNCLAPDYSIGMDPWAAWQQLIGLYTGNINAVDVTQDWYKKTSVRHDFDMVFNTMPLNRWCAGTSSGLGHIFMCTSYWSTVNAPFGPMGQGMILLDSDKYKPHYLQANLWGRHVVEWPLGHKPLLAVTKQIRPLDSNCDCAERYHDFINVGHMGEWDHNTTFDDTFYDVIDAIERPRQLTLGD